MLDPEVAVAIKRGLAYLEKQQAADGSFISFSSASMERFRRLRSWQTVFVPALILNSLAELTSPKVQPIRQRLADFLISQRNADWSFNYWTRQAPEYKTQSYPNDLDDTFCALAGLYRHDPSLIDEAVMAKIIKLLLATESTVGGPYRTWLVSADSPSNWLDIDVAVNSNIAYFLHLAGHQLPKLDAAMGQAIKTKAYTSPYYPSKYAFIYYFSRAYQGGYRPALLRHTIELERAATNDLDRTLCLNARLRLHDKTLNNSNLAALLANQRRDGSWPAATFYADPVKDGKAYYNGAAVLTTAFALEALQLSAFKQTPEPARKLRRRPQPSWQRLQKLAESQLQPLAPELQGQVLQLLKQQITSGNGGEISGLPQDFNNSLQKPLKPANSQLLDSLSLANLYGWTAYTIYDDFLDGEGQSALLPAANVTMRASLASFEEAMPAGPFRQVAHQTFDTIDSANAWEQSHCRFKVSDNKLLVQALPSYGNLGQLAERSLGHALPVLVILIATGLSPQDKAFQKVEQALRHYLIVRQLNDDLHDWREDLSHGHISYVVTRLLADLKLAPGFHAIAHLTTRAQRQFWHHSLPSISQEMHQHISRGRRALDASKLLRPTQGLYHLFDIQAASVDKTLTQQRQTIRFLKHYERS